jgi:hypothetical protein
VLQNMAMERVALAFGDANSGALVWCRIATKYVGCRCEFEAPPYASALPAPSIGERFEAILQQPDNHDEPSRYRPLRGRNTIQQHPGEGRRCLPGMYIGDVRWQRPPSHVRGADATTRRSRASMTSVIIRRQFGVGRRQRARHPDRHQETTKALGGDRDDRLTRNS